MDCNGYYLLLFKFIRRNKVDDLIEELGKNLSDCERVSLSICFLHEKINDLFAACC